MKTSSIRSTALLLGLLFGPAALAQSLEPLTRTPENGLEACGPSGTFQLEVTNNTAVHLLPLSIQ